MTTKAHSLLTGSDLHEPKGVTSATAGQVYSADGAGSGTWKKLDQTNLGGLANPFGANLIQISEQVSSGTGTSTSGASGTVTRVLNTTVVNQIAGASLSSNQITLPAGSYIGWFTFSGMATNITINSGTSNNFQSKGWLYDVTHSSAVVFGPAMGWTHFANTADNFNLQVTHSGQGFFTLAGASAVELRHYTSAGMGGQVINIGIPEVYSTVMIWRVA